MRTPRRTLRRSDEDNATQSGTSNTMPAVYLVAAARACGHTQIAGVAAQARVRLGRKVFEDALAKETDELRKDLLKCVLLDFDKK